MAHTLFPNSVVLEPISHTYQDSLGRQYLSVSKLLGLLSEKFEDTPAYARASDETRAQWKEKGRAAANHGTAIHNALELYSQTGQILAENAHMAEAIKSISAEYKDYHQNHDEICLYNNDYRVAGTADKICLLSNRKDSEFDIADFKTNTTGLKFYSDYKKRMYAPVDHLHDCTFTKYCLQLSIYAYFFEQLTGRKLRKMHVHYIPPHDLTKHYKIPVTYMKNDVQLILEAYKSQILQIVEPIQLYEF
jgi:hypothetical protein